MHKKRVFPFILCSYQPFSIIFPCRDIGPATATATLDPRPRHWTRDRDIGPATATLDPRPATISQTPLNSLIFTANPLKRMDNLKFAQESRLCALPLFICFYVFQNCTSLLCSQWFAERWISTVA